MGDGVDVLVLKRWKWPDARDSMAEDVMEGVAYDEPPERASVKMSMFVSSMNVTKLHSN
jgi:hypothetical protein